jgi:hypothetical protein
MLQTPMFDTGLARLRDGLAIKVLMAHPASTELGFLVDRMRWRLLLPGHVVSSSLPAMSRRARSWLFS